MFEYKKPEIEVVEFDVNDIITTSGEVLPGENPDETPAV